MNRRIGLVALAIVLALIGAGAVYSYAHNADKRAVDATRSSSVLIAKKSVPAGTTWSEAVKGDYFSQERLPVDSTPSTAIDSLDTSIPVDEAATADIASGQIVLRQMFADQTSVTGVLAIPKGKIAVSVTMPGDADVAGFVQPRSEVAIFGTFKLAKDAGKTTTNGALGGDDLYITRMVLPRVTVIATSEVAPSDLDKAPSSTGSTVLVTLALDQQDAQRVILAQQTAQLYLGLLSDSSVTSLDGGVINVGTFKPTPVFVK